MSQERNIAIAENLGKRLKLLRKNLKFSQSKLAEKIGSGSSGYISEIENGEKLPGAEVLYSLSRALGVTTDYLLSGDSDKINRQNMVKRWLNVHGSAGGGSFADEPDEYELFNLGDFANEIDDLSTVHMVQVRGDSMLECPDKSWVLFRLNGEVAEGKINFFQVNGLQYIKLVHRVDNGYALISTNAPSNLPPWIVKHGDDFRIFGPVIKIIYSL